MSDALHPFAEDLITGSEAVELRYTRARDLALYLASGADLDVVAQGIGRTGKYDFIRARVRNYPPQRPATDIRREEEIAVLFTADDRHPVLFALRADFPRGAHTNAFPESLPVCPCIDDRPWPEASLTWSPYAYVERLKWWFSAAADGGLVGAGQILDPLFVSGGPDLLIARQVLASLRSEGDYVLTPVGNDGDAPRALVLKAATVEELQHAYPFRVMVVELPPTEAGPLQSPPANLRDLIRAASEQGCDLLPRLIEWSRACDPVARTSKLVILLKCPVWAAREGGPNLERLDVQAFVVDAKIGTIGKALGLFEAVPGDQNAWGILLTRSAADLRALGGMRALSMDVQYGFDQDLGRACSGITTETSTPTMLLGAGAIGSHLALVLAKQGTHRFLSVVDDDWLRPHNVARHMLGPADIGSLKAVALARVLSEHEMTEVAPVVANIFGSDDERASIHAASAAVKIVIDATASVAVSRELAFSEFGDAHCAAVFFNPRGDAVIVLTEDVERAVRLDELEAQYYRLLIRDAALAGHLTVQGAGLRYSTACRALSARIPETRVAALAALAAALLVETISRTKPNIAISTLSADGSVTVVRVEAAQTVRRPLGEWSVILDDGLRSDLIRLRSEALPRETGGVLVGLIDTSRRVIVLVDALAPPPDSSSYREEFVRGTEGLMKRLNAISASTLGMVRYVGEWHTHPPGHSALPSAIDLRQLSALRAELGREALPATMLIVGRNGEFSIMQSGGSDT